ncbi:MAG: hypothetical protein DCC67_06760 [Planctomycetota bacterium]|nr:MAG: hypothetical protein DCC67_06760 [Planctomycetota bacterium]
MAKLDPHAAHSPSPPPAEPLPEALRPPFWDHSFDELDWAAHGDFIIGRILAAGDWNAVQGLRGRVGPQRCGHGSSGARAAD